MIHVHPDLPMGKVGFRSGPSMAGMSRFEIEVRGHGGHAARPHIAVDPVVIAAHIVIALQTLISRELDPTAMGLITLGSITSGTTHNVIPDTALIKGTIRAHEKRVMDQLRARIPELAGGVAQAMRAESKVHWGMAYPPLTCDDAMTELAAGAARELLGAAAVAQTPISMGSEDFAFVLEKVPGSVIAWVFRTPTGSEPCRCTRRPSTWTRTPSPSVPQAWPTSPSPTSAVRSGIPMA